MVKKLSFPTQKKILIVLLVSWAIALPFGITALLEMTSDIKYALVNSYYLISGIGVRTIFYCSSMYCAAPCPPQAIRN